MDNIIIRDLTPGDANDIIRINNEIRRETVQVDLERVVKKQAGGSGVIGFVAEYQDKIVGYMIGYILAGGFGIDKSAWVAMFGVDPKFMGQGIGKSLAEEVFRFCKKRGIKDIYTSVRWDSTDLLSFFKTLGFDRSNFINLRKVME